MSCTAYLHKEAREDIQIAIYWYNKKQKGLGRKFHREFLNLLSSLSKTPYYQVRYDEIHCLPMVKFPYMIHFTYSKKNKLIEIYGVFHTSLNPENFLKRKIK